MNPSDWPDCPEFGAAVDAHVATDAHVTRDRFFHRLALCQGCPHRAGLACGKGHGHGPLVTWAGLDGVRCPDGRWFIPAPHGASLSKRV